MANGGTSSQADEFHQQAVEQFGPALDRLASAYEADFELRRDLLQGTNRSFWRSFAYYDGRCSLRTWTYRVAHNVAASHVASGRRKNGRDWVSLETVDSLPSGDKGLETSAGRQIDLDRLLMLIHCSLS